MQTMTTPPPVNEAPRTPGIATTSLVLGILGITCLCPLLSIPAVICGHKAHGKIKRSGGAFGGAGLAIAGFITGYVGIVLMLLMLPLMLAIMVPAFVQARDAGWRAACTNNLRSLELAKEQWVLENGAQDGAAVPETALAEYVGGGIERFRCPAKGTYSINPTGVSPTCSVEGHGLGFEDADVPWIDSKAPE